MQLDVKKLTPKAHQVLVDCLIIVARHGRLLRESRTHQQVAKQICSQDTPLNIAIPPISRDRQSEDIVSPIIET